MFIDRARIRVIGGKGGDGIVSFHREKYVPRGGPDGGDGGRGGSVFLLADPERTTLSEFRHATLFAAEPGGRGGPNKCHGKKGTDTIIPVPLGTLVYAGDTLIADLSTPGERVCVARGGRGGLGNQHFATSTHQAPRFAQRGEPGESFDLELQLKLLADAGIVGAPNAGKSTLLATISSAKPKIADYPFTTLEPQLGVVRVDDDASFVAVDVPGLIEGASQGAGLGDQFLSHVERTRVLVHLVDGALEPQAAVAQLGMLERELAAWNPRLLTLRRLVVVSKLDLPQAQAVLQAVRDAAGPGVLGISAATTLGIRELVHAMYEAICEARARGEEGAVAADVVVRPRPHPAHSSVTVKREGRAFRLSGRSIERVAAMTDLESDEGRAYFDKALVRVGARRKLERAGAKPGDRVRIGETEIRLT
jgi:GTP-binding protein